jgi:energy-coupling factor transport system ATP-binding protein
MITAQNVNYRYRFDGRLSLSGIDLRVARGELVLLTGRSGCGKTTLTRCLNGLIPHFYEGEFHGEIQVGDIKPPQVPIHETAFRVGSVFQDPRSQFFTTNTTDEIAFGLENTGVEHPAMHDRIAETVQILGIQTLLDRSIFGLSSGEKQKIALASVCAMKPPVLLLDEPSANIDLAAIAQLTTMLETLKQNGHTLIIVEHRLYYLRDLVDRIVYMDKGHIVQSFTPQAFDALSEDALAEMGLRTFALERVTVNNIHALPPNAANVLQVEGVSVTLAGGKQILRDIHFAARAGEILGIVGENGAGKTTLINTVCGLQKEKTGRVLIDGKAVRGKERTKLTYLVMQDVDYQLFSDSVENELALGNEKSDHLQADIDTALELLSLEIYREDHPASLSGGEKQRVVIAGALVQDSSIVCFDEPTSGLDGDNMHRVSALLRILQKQGKAVIVISHDYEFIVRTCSRVICLHDGQLVDDYELNSASASKLLSMKYLLNILGNPKILASPTGE